MNKKIKIILPLTIIFTIILSVNAFASDFTNSTSTNSGFNRWNSKVYAEKWAAWPGNSDVNDTTNNPYKYINYASSGGDCTNFVSQVLRAGGMSMNGSSDPGYGHWYWYGSTSRSYSWTGVTQFMQYWANYNGTGANHAYSFKSYSLTDAMTSSTYYAIFKDLYEGDIIQYKGAIDHSQVVHKYDTTDLYMAQHGTTSDRFWCNTKLIDYLTWLKSGYGTGITVYTERMKYGVT